MAVSSFFPWCLLWSEPHAMAPPHLPLLTTAFPVICGALLPTIPAVPLVLGEEDSLGW